MEPRRDDPAYPLHDLERTPREREGPRVNATGQEHPEEQDENSAQQVQIRQNMNARPPSEVREEERRHGSPSALPPEEGES